MPTIFGPSATVTATPAGVIEMFGGSSAPTGYLMCDGSAVSRTTFANLFAVIGTAYGPGDGSTTFNLPNMNAKFPRGGAPGTTGGADSHSHPLSNQGGASSIASAADSGVMTALGGPGGWTATRKLAGTVSTVSVSEGASAALIGQTDAANNVPAYVCVQFIIKT
jgi:microcystin-dependent protein